MADNSLIRSTSIYTIGVLIAKSISFLLLPIYSNYLTTNEFGTFVLLMSFYAIISVLYQAGLSAGMTKYYLEEKSEENRALVFSSTFNFIFFCGLFISITLTIFAKNISELVFSGENYYTLFIILIWTLFIDTINFYILHLFKTKSKFNYVSLINIANSFITLFLSIIFIVIFNFKLMGVFLALLSSGIITFLILSPKVIGYFKFKIRKDYLISIFKFGIPLLIGGIFSTLIDVVDRFILDYFLPREEVGIYGFAYRIALIMNVVVLSFRTTWTPYSINSYNSNSYSKDFGKIFEKIIFIMLFIFLITSLSMDEIFKIKFNEIYFLDNSYYTSIVIIPYILLAYLFNGLVSFYSVYPYVSGKSYYFLIADGLAFILNIILNFLLIPKLGIEGAAIATLFSFVFSFLYLFYISYRKIKIDYNVMNIFIIVGLSIIVFFLSNQFNSIALDVVLLTGYTLLILSLLKLKINSLFNLLRLEK